MLEALRMTKYRFTLQAGKAGLELPPWKASTFRGGFGHVFKRLTCIHPDAACRSCPAASYCAYTYVFETEPTGGDESMFMGKYEQIPRPFVLETPNDKQTLYEPGELIHAQLLLFGKAIQYAPLFVSAFKELGTQGLGKGRRETSLLLVENIHPLNGSAKTVYLTGKDNAVYRPIIVSGQEILDYVQQWKGTREISLFFETPLRLKSGGSYTDEPRFAVIFRSVLRRVTGLLQHHHGGEAEEKVDFRDLLAKAEKVRLVRHDTRWVEYDRYSARQNGHMKLGGIMGWANYEGDALGELLPWLKAAELLHIGKNTVFDLGRIRVIV